MTVKLFFLAFLLAFFSACSSPSPGLIILCAGDSITEAAYPRFLQRLLVQEGVRSKVLNYGRSGHTSGEYLNFLKNNEERLVSERPDIILLQLGTNDVRVDGDHTAAEEFQKNMRAVIGIFQGFRSRSGRSARLLLATIPPIPQGSPFPFSDESGRRVREEINPLIQKISAEFRLPLVDNYSLFLKQPEYLPEVHPSEEGYRALARNWFEALEPFLSEF